MLMDGLSKFFVYTEHVRGEARTWCVADRSDYRIKWVSRHFTREAPARKLCDRMNKDWERYERAKLEGLNDHERKATSPAH